MTTISITKVRENSEEDWNAIQETLYLNSIPSMMENIIEAGKEPLEECSVYEPNEEW